MDPQASQFISRFLALSRGTHLAHLTALNTSASLALAAALQPLTEAQWGGLRQYAAELAAGYGAEAFAGVAATKPFILDAVRAAIQVR